MKRRITLAAALAVAALALAALAPTASASASPAAAKHQQPANVKTVCGTAKAGHARCFSSIRTDVHGGRGVRGRAAAAAGATGAATALPAGYGPADLSSAYNLPAAGGSGQTVAIVDAYDDPTAESDLAVYRATYGLPACTTANGCFTKVNQAGQQGSYPASDAQTGWEVETSLDVDMVSAVCPSCRILLVEGNSDADADLAAAVNTAAGLGATEITNSYGEDESLAMLPLMAAYSHPGIAIVAATGDNGFRFPSFPAVSPSVIAVGGTTLQRDPGSARGWSETAWSEAGSGCSAWIGKPAWQTGVPDCPGRVTGDVSAVADPDVEGLAIYDTTPNRYGFVGWMEMGGTSAASPIIAGVIALAGNPGSLPDASYVYNHAASLNDVTSGYNGYFGFDCGGDNLCNAMPGYDGPTGLGTPDGVGAF
jgi:subtilase family serine protease